MYSFVAGLLGGIGGLILTIILVVVVFLCRRRRRYRRAGSCSTPAQPAAVQQSWSSPSRPKPGRTQSDALHEMSTYSTTPLFASRGWRGSGDPIADLRALVEHPHTSPFRAQYAGRASPSSLGERFVQCTEWSESGSIRCRDLEEGDSVVGKAV